MRTPDGDMAAWVPGPLQLAYLGDAVWELHVRRAALKAGPGKPDALHRRAVRRVHAAAQARVLQRLEPSLTNEEKDIVRRGRNAKGHAPRGADPLDYRYSTAFECLLGYLYYTGQTARLAELLRMADEEEAAGTAESTTESTAESPVGSAGESPVGSAGESTVVSAGESTVVSTIESAVVSAGESAAVDTGDSAAVRIVPNTVRSVSDSAAETDFETDEAAGAGDKEE